MDSSPPGSSVYGDSPDKNTGVGCHAFIQGIFSTQGLSPGLPHFRRILYYQSHQSLFQLCKWHNFSTKKIKKVLQFLSEELEQV